MAVTQALSDDLVELVLSKPGHRDNVALTGSGAAVAYTIPALCTTVALSPYPKSADFLGNPTGTAARPAGNVTDGTASIPNPFGFRGLTPGGTLSFVAGTADVNVCILCYREKGGPA